MNYKTVFIMGTGATRGALPHVIIDRKRLRPPLNGDFFKVATTYVRAKKDLSESNRLGRLTKFFKVEMAMKRMPPMEDAFSLLYSVKDFPEIYKTGRGRKRTVGEHQEIEDFLQLTFRILTALDSNTGRSNGYDRLVSKLGPNDTILTLNYDTVLDSALVSNGWNPKDGYCIIGDHKKIMWSPKNSLSNPGLAGVQLLKLHGSINWFVRGSSKDLSAIFEKKPVKVSSPRRNDIRNHIRQIIPPIYGKFFHHNHWRHLWSNAYRSLCEADVLVVIGCSLIDSDFHLRALLSRVTRYRKEQGKLFQQAFYVDPNLKIRRKWMDTMHGVARHKISVNCFEKFLKEEWKS